MAFGRSSDGLLEGSLAFGCEAGELLLEDEDGGGVAAPEPEDGAVEAGVLAPDDLPASATGSDEWRQ